MFFLNLLRSRALLNPDPCKDHKEGHVWEKLKSNSAIRKCSCGAEEWLFEKRYPKVGEAKYNWRRKKPIPNLSGR